MAANMHFVVLFVEKPPPYNTQPGKETAKQKRGPDPLRPEPPAVFKENALKTYLLIFNYYAITSCTTFFIMLEKIS